MMSRAVYKGMKIDWDIDECSQPFPKAYSTPKKDHSAPPSKNKASTTVNRFQMLNMDGDGTEDGSNEDSEPPILSNVQPMHINRQSPWNARSIAA